MTIFVVMAQHTDGLNDAQKRFCEEYVYDWNGARAYKVAYPKATDATARTNASLLLTKPNIQAYLKHIKSNLQEIAGISRLKVLKEHQKLAFTNIADLHNTWITRKEFDDLTPEQKAAIASIETQIKVGRDKYGKLSENEFVKIRLHDKQKALEAISKMLGYNEPDQVEGELTIKVVRE